MTSYVDMLNFVITNSQANACTTNTTLTDECIIDAGIRIHD